MRIKYLFVYGSLKPGEKAHHYFDQIQGIWCDAYCFGNWIDDIDIGYPIISLDTNGEKIEGKLFHSNQLQNIIKEIDQYEGEEYKRVITKIYLNNGSSLEAFIYEKKGK
tara:strand:- start:126 stop:452 length:327 start_codon:yes stop_codon:yes gene_type:complete